ncbi:MAG: ferrous iron transport protein B [Myxococcales bacterium]|nr:ferrous iron transport protein B [Myxococcales bacterium]
MTPWIWWWWSSTPRTCKEPLLRALHPRAGSAGVVALNMMDEVRSAGDAIAIEALATTLGVPVVPISARSGEGLEDLVQAIERALDSGKTSGGVQLELDASLRAPIEEVATRLGGDPPTAMWAVGSLAATDEMLSPEDEDHPFHGNPTLEQQIPFIRDVLRRFPELPAKLVEARHVRAAQITEAVRARSSTPRVSITDRLDQWFLHPFAGGLIFGLLLMVMFQGLFAWSEPFMSGIEDLVGALQEGLRSVLFAGALTDLLVDGVVGGVGNVIVFVPQIAFLFFFLGVLEDSGYLARAAYISDRFMARVGLHGRAFVPLLSGFACAVPAIMATRAIENRRDRLVTILVLPLMSCSARLPVYTLMIGSLFAGTSTIFGFLSVGGLLLMLMYTLSVTVAIAAAFVLKRTVLRSPAPPLVLELPPYRLPRPQDVLRRVFERCWAFVRDAGTIILALSILLWALLYFPRAPEGASPGEQVRSSFAGRVGHAIEPVVEPLGYDWKIGVGLLASFAAREVFVSTMGLVYDVGEDVDEENVSLRDRIRSEVRPETGTTVFTPLVGLSLMIFFLLSAQCMSTLAVIRRETRSWRWPLFSFAYMTILAWSASFIVYQGGRLLGFS